MRCAAFLAALLALAFLGACQEGKAPHVLPAPSAQRSYGDVQVALRLDTAIYAAGQPAQMTLTLTNRGAATFVFYRSGQRYDFEVLGDGSALWRWSADKVFTQELAQETLDPGELLTYSETWYQRDSEGETLPPGQYTARGTIVGCRDQSFQDCGFTVEVPFEIAP